MAISDRGEDTEETKKYEVFNICFQLESYLALALDMKGRKNNELEQLSTSLNKYSQGIKNFDAYINRNSDENSMGRISQIRFNIGNEHMRKFREEEMKETTKVVIGETLKAGSLKVKKNNGKTPTTEHKPGAS